MHLSTRSIAAVVLAAVLVGCGPDTSSPTPAGTPVVPTASPSATEPATDAAPPSPDASPSADARTPDGWERIVVADAGLSVAIPGGWEQLSADVIGDSGLMDEMLAANPDAAAAIEQAQAAIAGGDIALFAFDASRESLESGFAANINAINVGDPGGTAADAAGEVAAVIEQQVPVVGEVETEVVSLPAGDAALVRYEWEVQDATGAAQRVAVRQYAIIGDRSGTGFILSMSAAADAVDAYEEVFRRVAESFAEEPA